jgi:hypothetical protein
LNKQFNSIPPPFSFCVNFFLTVHRTHNDHCICIGWRLDFLFYTACVATLPTGVAPISSILGILDVFSGEYSGLEVFERYCCFTLCVLMGRESIFLNIQAHTRGTLYLSFFTLFVAITLDRKGIRRSLGRPGRPSFLSFAPTTTNFSRQRDKKSGLIFPGIFLVVEPSHALVYRQTD